MNQELSSLFNELWSLDVNRMTPGTDYTINVQVPRLLLRVRPVTRHVFAPSFLVRPGPSWLRPAGQQPGAGSRRAAALLQRE